ncbi:hypothetical protein DdX_13343 [Ditylenchus destructor]|uniref:ShKT domain-containing protein n=1 Tax=Ditylenchus destructor TaxID=166010 RepID=A0AAD4MYW1_9BILA|nr:hypothetical protein DdX_13343 [Ditylenchus destructor]
MVLKASRVLLLLWIFVGIPLKCAAQSEEEKEAEKAISDSTAILKEVNDAVTEVTRVATSVDDTNLPSPPADAGAATPAKTAANTAATEAKAAREKLQEARHKGAEVLARLDRHRIAMVAWNAEADRDDAALATPAKFNTEEATKAADLRDRIDAAIGALAITGPLAENGKRTATVDGAGTTAATTAGTSLTTARRKYWAARNVENAAETITEMTGKATAARDRVTGGLTTAANGARDTAGNVLTAANNLRVSKDKAAAQKALNDAKAVLAQARTLENEALDIQNDVASMDTAIKAIKADAGDADRVAILALTDAARDAIGTAAAAGINSARLTGAGAREPGAIQKAIEDADLAIIEAQRVLSLLDAMDDIAKSVAQMKTAVDTATSERQRSKTEHDKTTALQTEADAAVAATQAAQRDADTAAKATGATEEDKAALKRADDDLRKVTDERTKVVDQITTAGTEDARAEAARVIVAGRSTAATTASTEIDTNIGTVATATIAYGDTRKFLSRLRVAAAKKGVEAVTNAANAVAKAYTDAKTELDLAKRWADKAKDQTPEGRKKADQVAERVMQEDIEARTAEANRKAMEKAMKLAQAQQQAAQAQQQAAQEQTDMTNQQQDQQTQQQIQNQLPVDANGAIVNIDHLYDDVYVQPAAGDSDVNCLNNLHRCNEPAIAAQCAGTCTRQENGDDHADNCARMNDLCLEEHYRDLMSTYCVGTCG